MQQIAPAGQFTRLVLCLVTLAMVAGLSTLEHPTTEVYETINAATQKLIDGLVSAQQCRHSCMRKSRMRHVQFVFRS